VKVKFSSIIKKKWLADKLITGILILLILAAYLGISHWMNSAAFSDIDLTESKIYSLSTESISKIKNIDKEVKITFINFNEYDYVVDFAKKYTAKNRNIKIEVVSDLTSRVDLVQKYGLNGEQDLIIVESGENETTFSSYDLYTYDYTTYEQIDRTEEAFTNAILNVSTNDKPKIYFMTGKNYYSFDYFGTLISAINAEANELDTVDLFTVDDVPADCDTLVITTLGQDITEKERDSLIRYIKNGGKILALLDPTLITGVTTPNLNLVFSEFGVKVSEGVIYEQNANHMIANSPEFIIADVIAGNSITQKIDSDMSFCAIYSGRVEFLEQSKLEEIGVAYEELVTTSNSAFLRKDLSIQNFYKTNSDEDAGNSIIGALVNKKIDDAKDSKLVIFSSALLATDIPVNIGQYQVLPIGLYNNKDMLLNSVSYLNDKEDSITIRKKYDGVSYTITEEQNRIIISLIVFVPLLIIIVGIIVARVRRRKR